MDKIIKLLLRLLDEDRSRTPMERLTWEKQEEYMREVTDYDIHRSNKKD